GLRRRVTTYDVGHWVRSFLGALEEATGASELADSPPSRAATPPAVVERLRAAAHLLLLLDYDGTLVPHASVPELATADEPLLDQAAARTPGSLVEHKTVSLAWHYRMADPEFGAAQANELRLHLTELLSNLPVEIVPGDKMIEVRPHGVHKGVIVPALLAEM